MQKKKKGTAGMGDMSYEGELNLKKRCGALDLTTAVDTVSG